METALLQTKFYIPPPRPKKVSRPHLVERLGRGIASGSKLTLISAPAGFGKTTLVSEWVHTQRGDTAAIAWLSLDESDNDLNRFLSYFIAALNQVEGIEAPLGKGIVNALQSPQPPPSEAVLTTLINEIAALPAQIIFVLDDYHLIEAQPIHDALAFLLHRLPPQLHLVIATREDPPLSLARLRARGQLTELRAADLRFTTSEAAEFFNQAMDLGLSAEDITALERRTEGWIAGLQLAAVSLRGHKDVGSFIHSFTGSHHFVLDYLVEEVLNQQPESIQNFLLYTSILDRLCGSLCDAVLCTPTATGQETLEYLERANLFIVPLDNERHWYRYHHLFVNFLRQRLYQDLPSLSSSPSGRKEGESITELHIRASQWYEDNNLVLEAFHHAAAANDIERAERLIGGDRIPQHFRGAVTAVLDWLGSLPKAVLDTRPWLWWRYASLLLVNGQTTGVEEKLQAAEAALQDAASAPGAAEGADDETRNLVGRIAAARATLALTRYQPKKMLTQSRRALEYLHPNSLLSRASANWTLGYAYLYKKNYAAAHHALTEAISISQASEDIFTTILAAIGLGNVQEAENQLYSAAKTYRHVLQLAGDQPLQIVSEAHLGLARVLYEWNDLDAAEQHGQLGLQLARQYERVIDRFIRCEVFLARLKLARGDVAGATAMLHQTDQSVRQRNFVQRAPEVAVAQVLVLLQQDKLAAAAHLVRMHELPLSRARIELAQGDPVAALAVLEPFRRQVEAKSWQDELLRVSILQAIAHDAHGEKGQAVQRLAEALALAASGGFIRIFVDEGPPMVQLLSEVAARGMMTDYVGTLLAAFEAEEEACWSPPQPLIEPLSERELDVLHLIAEGLSNREIGERLFIALSTVKGHNRRIFDKLQVHRRTEAVARARELGLL
jgi:LuxR family maltose regulon positive regulatory protein